MSSKSHTPIKFVFIGNLSTKSILHQESFTYLPSTEKDVKQIFDRWCQLKDHKFSEHSKVPNKNGNYYFTSLKPNQFYLVLAEFYYDEAEIFNMINEIHSKLGVDYNEDNIQEKVNEVILKRQKSQNTSISEINQDINELQVEMRGNVRNLIGNNNQLENLQSQSNQIKDKSLLFENNAREAKRVTCMQNMKLWIILGLIVFAIFLAIIIPLAFKSSKSDTKSQAKEIDIVIKKSEIDDSVSVNTNTYSNDSNIENNNTPSSSTSETESTNSTQNESTNANTTTETSSAVDNTNTEVDGNNNTDSQETQETNTETEESDVLNFLR